MDQRATGKRGLHIDHRRQFFVVYRDCFRRIFGLRISLGDYDGDLVANIANLTLGQRRMCRFRHGGTVFIVDTPTAGNAADAVGGHVVADEHRKYAVSSLCRSGVDVFNVRMRQWTTQYIGVGLSRAVNVVGIRALAGQESKIFLSLDGGANSCRAHVTSPMCSLFDRQISLFFCL